MNIKAKFNMTLFLLTLSLPSLLFAKNIVVEDEIDNDSGIRYRLQIIAYDHLLTEVFLNNGEKVYRLAIAPSELNELYLQNPVAENRDGNPEYLTAFDTQEILKLGKKLSKKEPSRYFFYNGFLARVLERVGEAELTRQRDPLDALIRTKYKTDFLPLCQHRNTVRASQYRANGKNKIVSAFVGNEVSMCYGRCGSRCGSYFPFQTYTQECLAHDLCHRVEGEQLGVCEGEFEDAIVGTGFGAIFKDAFNSCEATSLKDKLKSKSN